MKFKVNPLFLFILFGFTLLGFFEKSLFAFILVFLHELSHFLMARVVGYKIYKIELFPFGGVAEYMGLLEMDPPAELLVALAGPLFNFLVIVILNIIKLDFEYIPLIIELNLIIGLFNLLPVLPLDGGRILRSLFVLKFGFKKGTKITLKISQFFAFVSLIISILILLINKSNIWLLLLSFFIYGALINEKKQYIYNFISYLSRRKTSKNSFRNKRVYLHALDENNNLSEAINCIVPGKLNIFYVLNYNIEIEKVLTEAKLIEIYFSTGKSELKLKNV